MVCGLRQVAKKHGLSVRGLGGEHTPIGADGTVDISPSARFCITEGEIMGSLYNGIEALCDAEKSLGEVILRLENFTE